MSTTTLQNQLVNPHLRGHAQRACPLHVFLHFEDNTLKKITLKNASAFRLFLPTACPLKEEVVAWFENYLLGKITSFPLPLPINNGPFTQKVLSALLAIPFGSTASYKEIAEKVGSPAGFRAVGNACHTNPFPLVIPCHRVLKSDGSLGGFAYGLKMKQSLLDFEQVARAQSRSFRDELAELYDKGDAKQSHIT